MPFKYLVNMTKQCSKNFSTNIHIKTCLDQVQIDYENAIKALNSLQSNADYIKKKAANTQQLPYKEARAQTTLDAQKYLLRADVSLETLDTLSVIHVSGTKGKGSTCALCESILRHHGFRTGFYSSPHLIEVRERICINGVPMLRQDFTRHFWEVYNKLYERQSSPTDMPKYFTFLTIMAFKVFLMEKVDVAIIEVGIGGEFDCTNILRKVPVVGITSLGLDHTAMLGNTIEKIAWNKAGIIKPGSVVYTVPQTQLALEVLKERGIERDCSSFEIVKPLQNLLVDNANHYPKDIFSLNASLAVALAHAWINLKHMQNDSVTKPEDMLNCEATRSALLHFSWFGRFQVIHNDSNTFYIDGAHTQDSIQICAEWFNQMVSSSTCKRVLIFNATGDRDSEVLLKMLINCHFDKVFFVPNKSSTIDSKDMKNYNSAEEQQVIRCHNHKKIWTNFNVPTETIKVLPSFADVLAEGLTNVNFLITGSLHLVGAALSIIADNSKSNS